MLWAGEHVIENTVYLSLVARESFWTVFLDPETAYIVASMPLDPF